MEINDVVCKQDTRPLIKITSGPIMVEKWLFERGTGITCMSSQQFRLIPIKRRPAKLNLNQREARGASGGALILDRSYLFLMQWNGKSVMQTVIVFKNLSSPLILCIDAVDNLGITYLSRTKSLIFQENMDPKANLKECGLGWHIRDKLIVPLNGRLDDFHLQPVLYLAFKYVSMDFRHWE
jgi:hypothetical protein